jgi:hypothetical protein
MHMLPLPEVVDRVTRALGVRPLAWRPVDANGNRSYRRYEVALPLGSTAFVKMAATPDAADRLRSEFRIYEALRGPFIPALRGWDDDGDYPVLALEDLSPLPRVPPWTQVEIDAVLKSLFELAGSRPPPGTPKAIHTVARDLLPCWDRLAADPKPFLRLGVCSESWLDHALPLLRDAARAAPIAGDMLMHMDVRSDHLFLREGWAVMVDWTWACVGNPILDLAAWLPSLHAEGGPAPEKILPDDEGFATLLAGYFAYSVTQPPVPLYPRVRDLQFTQLRTTLPWAPGP